LKIHTIEKSIIKFQIAATLLALTSAASATVMHVVSVGKDGNLAFCPDSIQAVPGDLVQFQFYPKNHSVVQGFFAQGCTPISEAPAPNTAPGSFSGFMPVDNSSTSGTIPTFTITVNGTGPTWWYCSQAKHCQSGMAFAINPNANKTIDGYKANCAAASANLTPGQGSPPPAAVPPPSQGTAAAGAPPAGVAPTGVSLPTEAPGTAPNAAQTALPINSLASSTISRTAGWAIAGLAGVLTVGMLL